MLPRVYKKEKSVIIKKLWSLVVGLVFKGLYKGYQLGVPFLRNIGSRIPGTSLLSRDPGVDGSPGPGISFLRTSSCFSTKDKG